MREHRIGVFFSFKFIVLSVSVTFAFAGFKAQHHIKERSEVTDEWNGSLLYFTISKACFQHFHSTSFQEPFIILHAHMAGLNEPKARKNLTGKKWLLMNSSLALCSVYMFTNWKIKFRPSQTFLHYIALNAREMKGNVSAGTTVQQQKVSEDNGKSNFALQNISLYAPYKLKILILLKRAGKCFSCPRPHRMKFMHTKEISLCLSLHNARKAPSNWSSFFVTALSEMENEKLDTTFRCLFAVTLSLLHSSFYSIHDLGWGLGFKFKIAEIVTITPTHPSYRFMIQFRQNRAGEKL